MNNSREKFEAWLSNYELQPNTELREEEHDLMLDAWQAATEQSQKEIAELQGDINSYVEIANKDANTIVELQAREKVLVEYKNSVIDQFVTAHHSYDESISAYENISKLIAYHQDIALDPKVSSVAARWVTQIEGLQAREKELVEAISSSLNCIREEINLNNYTETLLGDFISYYGDMVIILQYALANVRGE